MKGYGSECQCLILLLLHQTSICRPDRFQVLGPAAPVVAVAGEDVVLPCYLKPNISALDMRVEWFRLHPTDRLVHLYQDGEYRNSEQIQSYRGRTDLFLHELWRGNASLRLARVQGFDHGRYKCFLQSSEWYDDSSIYLDIKAVGSDPLISVEGHREGGVGLLCETKGWHPEPDVAWLDSEGRRLAAGHSEVLTDMQGLFLLRRTLVVQKGNARRFTCRVSQLHLEQVKEAHIHLQSEAFPQVSPWTAATLILLAQLLGALIGSLAFVRIHLRLQRTRDDLQRNNACLIAQLEFQRVRQHAVDVTLDPSTAHPWLFVSEDLKEVSYGDRRQEVADVPERFDLSVNILAQEGWVSGRAYWEVEVGDKPDWDLGVAHESAGRKGKISLSPERGFWAVWLRNGAEYKALAEPHILLSVSAQPSRVGVFVDYDEGQVSFYSASDRSHIYTFEGLSFKGKLYPFFSPGVSPTPLVICPVNKTL